MNIWLYHINPKRSWTYGWDVMRPETMLKREERRWPAGQMFRRIAVGDLVCVYMKNIGAKPDGVYVVGVISGTHVDSEAFSWKIDERRCKRLLAAPVEKAVVQEFFGRAYGGTMQRLPDARCDEWLRIIGGDVAQTRAVVEESRSEVRLPDGERNQAVAPFVVGQIYNRKKDIHAVYGGQEQGGICTPSGYPLIFLFTGPSGEQHGYHDEFRPDGTFWLTGEGQRGDMKLVRGNRAVQEHEKHGLSMHLFEDAGSGTTRYVGVATCLGHHWEERPDTDGRMRKAIIFELDVSGALSERAALSAMPAGDSAEKLWSRPLGELKELAAAAASRAATPVERRAVTYRRSQAVRVYVLRRADGVCEACGRNAPFRAKDGRPFLEPHHMQRLSDGGPDDPARVAGVCPNCHRAAHYGRDAQELNRRLTEVVLAKESGAGQARHRHDSR